MLLNSQMAMVINTSNTVIEAKKRWDEGKDEKKEEIKEKGKELILSVRDTGTGIHPQIMSRLFTKFASKSETSGTGLGLFISKSIIVAHGGKLWAQNNSDSRGATFSLSSLIIVLQSLEAFTKATLRI